MDFDWKKFKVLDRKCASHISNNVLPGVTKDGVIPFLDSVEDEGIEYWFLCLLLLAEYIISIKDVGLFSYIAHNAKFNGKDVKALIREERIYKNYE